MFKMMNRIQSLFQRNCEQKGTTSAKEHPKSVLQPTEEVSRLTQSALSSLYAPYEERSSLLISQVLHLLDLEYDGDVQNLCHNFLVPAANLLDKLKSESLESSKHKFKVSDHTWPLCIDRKIVIHLGEIDRHHVKSGDFYFCVLETSLGVQLVMKYWFYGHIQQLVIQEQAFSLIFSSNWLMSVHTKNNEKLSNFLKHCLVATDSGIERILWDYLVPLAALQRHEKTVTCPVNNSHMCENIPVLDEITKEVYAFPNLVWDSISELSAAKDYHLSEQDDGFHDNCLTQPKSIDEINDDILFSGAICLTGSRDREARAVITLSAALLKSYNPLELTRLLMYFYSVPRVEVTKKGLTLVIDSQNIQKTVMQALDEVFYLLEANIPGAINQVLLLRNEDLHFDQQTVFQQSQVKVNSLKLQENIFHYIEANQLPIDLGGNLIYNHSVWITLRKKLEPFALSCRFAAKHLLNKMQELKNNTFPDSALQTRAMIEKHKQYISETFEDPQLLKLQKDGESMLKDLQKDNSPMAQTEDFRDSLDQVTALYNEVHKVLLKLNKVADKRLLKLEQCLQFRIFEEDSSKIISWLRVKGEETLNKNKNLADNLNSIQMQEREFDKFYFGAMHHIEKGKDLLEEASTLTQMGHFEVTGIRDLAKSLKQYLKSFTDRLEETHEKIEAASKCYFLLDKSYEWALDAMKYVSHLKTEPVASPQSLNKLSESLQSYFKNHPIISEENFNEMLHLAAKIGNDKLLEQCKVARARCLETEYLIKTRKSTLLKAKEQMEAEIRQQKSAENDIAYYSKNMIGFSDPFWIPKPSVPSYILARRRSYAGSSSTPLYSQSYIHKDSYKIDNYISEVDENLLDAGLITEDLTPLGALTCIPQSLLQSRTTLRGSQESLVASRHFALEGQSSSSNSKANKPFKKVMRRSHTWQLGTNLYPEMDEEIKAQSRRKTTSSISEVSDDNLPSLPDGLSGRQLPWRPLNVNSHLHSSQLSLNLPPYYSLLSEHGISECNLKKHRTLMLVMREMIQTERDYVHSLEYIIENYIPDILSDNVPQPLRGQRNVIFGNIEKIYEFHNCYFLQELENCDNSPFQVGQCFLKHESQFYLYALYNKNKPKSDALMAEYGTTFFKTKQRFLSDKMDLSSYLLKPVQRMGKYALLLKQLLKDCPHKKAEYMDLKLAEEMVRFQLRHGNDLLVMDSLKDCDVNLKEQGRLLRQDVFLVWQGKRKSLRRIFLFEDLILFSKMRTTRDGNEVYQYKFSLKMTDIGMTEQIGESNTKFEIWFRKCKASDTYILQSQNMDIKTMWTKELANLLWKQALKNRELRLAEMSSMGIGNKPCLDIRPNEDQISDRSLNLSNFSRVPRFRNSIAVSSFDHLPKSKRPNSIVSVSSSSSSSSHSSGMYLNLAFDALDSPRPQRRSFTQSSAESGICADLNDHCTRKPALNSPSSSNRLSLGTPTNSSRLSPSSPGSPLVTDV